MLYLQTKCIWNSKWKSFNQLSLRWKPPSRRPSSANYFEIKQNWQGPDSRWQTRDELLLYVNTAVGSSVSLHPSSARHLMTQTWPPRLRVPLQSSLCFNEVRCCGRCSGFVHKNFLPSFNVGKYPRRQCPERKPYRWTIKCKPQQLSDILGEWLTTMHPI